VKSIGSAPPRGALSVALTLSLLVLSSISFVDVARAEPPTGWMPTGEIHQVQGPKPNGRKILFSFHEAVHPASGRTGIIVTVHRIRESDGFHVGLEIKAIPKSDLMEFDSLVASRAYVPSLARGLSFGDIVDIFESGGELVVDAINAGLDIIKVITQAAQNVINFIESLDDIAQAAKNVVVAVFALAGEISSAFGEETVMTGNPDAVVRFAQNVSGVAAMNMSLSQKMAESFRMTIDQEATRAGKRQLRANLHKAIRDL